MREQGPSGSGTAETRRTGDQRTSSLRPLRRRDILEPGPLPCDAGPGQPSSAETTTAPRNRSARSAWSHRAGYYGLALLFVAAAALLYWVAPAVRRPTPFLVFYLAWVGAAAFGGLGPGLLAAVASWLCVDLLFDSTPWHVGLREAGSVGRLAVLLVGGLALSVVGEKMRRVRIRRRRQEKELAAAHTALRESEQRSRRMAESCARYRGLVEKINDWAWEVDANCVYTYSSPRARELLGYAPEEIVGKTPFDFMPPDEAERIRNAFWPICRARQPLELLENTLVRKDGRLVIVETSGMPMFAEDGTFRGYTGIDRDVTARRQAEEALRASEEKYRFLVENSQDITYMIDLQSKWIFISSNIEKVTGYRADELIGRPIWGLLAPECHDLARENMRRRVRGEDLPPYEVVAVGKDGRRTPLEVYAGSIIDDGGNVVGVQGVARDITERQRAEEALRASEEKYRFLVENSKDITWRIDVQGRWTFVSGNVEKATGYRADEIIGKTLWDFLAPECHDLVRERLQRRLHGEDLPPYEVVIVGKDGRRTPFELHAVTIVDEEGNVVGVQGVSRDITERQRAEEALRASEEKYRFLVENSKDVTWTVDLQGRWTFISSNMEKATGYRPDEVLGKVFWDFLAPECRDLVQEKLRRRARGADLPPYEVTFIGKDGQRTSFEIVAASIADDSGHVVGVQGVARDITERKRAEQDLRESRNKYQALIETTADFIWEMDASGRYTYCSPQMKDLWGYEPQSMIGKTPFDVMPPEDRKQARESFMALARSPKPFTGLEASSYDRQGRLITVEISGVPFFDADGRLLGYRGISRDVTGRKRAQEALGESRKKYRGLVEKINDWVWEVDADGVYTYASPRALELLGYAPEEIVGKSPFDLMPPDEAARVWNAFQSIWSERKPLELFENTLRRKDGRRVTVETSGMPVFAEDGSFQGYTGIDRDVTSRKQAEEALRESEEKFRLLAETSPAAILIYQDDRYVYVNPAAESLTGYRRAELLPQAPGEVVHPDFRRRVKEMAARRAQGEGTPTHYELKILTKDGRERWMDSETVSIMYGNRPAGLVMAFDVTERKQAEEALRRSEEQFHHLFEDDLTGNVISTPDGEIVLCNPAFAQIFGFSCAAEAVGTNIVDLYLDPRERRLLLERLQQEGKVERLEVWHRRRDGEPIYIVENIVGRFDEQGRLCEVKGYLFEDTQRKRAEEALHELTATLESRVAERTAELEERARQLQKLTLELSEAEERERERVAQILHDDLQQVLAAAKFHLSRVGGGTGSPDQSREIIGQVKEMLKNAIEQSRHLSHELSPVVLRQGDLAEALDWLAEQMQTKHGVTVRVEAVGTVATESDAVKTLLYRSAQEMLFNVVKHARVKEARLRVRRRGRYLCLSVSDRGRGFDPQEIGKTTGFGLLNIRERVALLGGRMKVRSAKGRGTTCRIIVPDVESSPRM
jgi:PAS domain S-box-containing protein